MHLQKLDWILIGIFLLSLLLLGFALELIPPEIRFIVGIGYLGVLILIIQLEIYRRTQIHLMTIAEDRKSEYHQIESLFSVFSSLNNKAPLPTMREWAISPDFAKLVMSSIYKYQPQTIVELGSGVSTIISSYCLQAINNGTVISIDHDAKYAEVTKNNLLIHGLQDIARVKHIPLKSIILDNQTFNWYDPEKLYDISELQKIDLLIVDGPPVSFNDLARYPALPILHQFLSDNAIILVDDANRIGEQKIVDLWLNQYDDLEFKLVAAEKGAIILQKVSSKKYLGSKKSNIAAAFA